MAGCPLKCFVLHVKCMARQQVTNCLQIMPLLLRYSDSISFKVFPCLFFHAVNPFAWPP